MSQQVLPDGFRMKKDFSQLESFKTAAEALQSLCHKNSETQMREAETEPVTPTGTCVLSISEYKMCRLYLSSGRVDENTHVCLLAAA